MKITGFFAYLFRSRESTVFFILKCVLIPPVVVFNIMTYHISYMSLYTPAMYACGEFKMILEAKSQPIADTQK